MRSGFVYVVGYSNGMVKAGYSESKPEGRIQSHDRTMGISGATQRFSYITPRIKQARSIESMLIRSFSSRSQTRSREWFTEVDPQDMVNYIKNHMEVMTDEEHQKEIEDDRLQGDRMAEAIINGLDRTFDKRQSRLSDKYWQQCSFNAVLLKEVVIGTERVSEESLESGVEFEGDPKIYPNFLVNATVTLYVTPMDEWWYLFQSASLDPLGVVMEVYEKAVEVLESYTES